MRSRGRANQRQRAAVAHRRPPCHICGRPIDYALSYPHPESFVIDHVIPLAAGGSDALDNLRAAHAACNNAKGAGAAPPRLETSGSLA